MTVGIVGRRRRHNQRDRGCAIARCLQSAQMRDAGRCRCCAMPAGFESRAGGWRPRSAVLARGLVHVAPVSDHALCPTSPCKRRATRQGNRAGKQPRIRAAARLASSSASLAPDGQRRWVDAPPRSAVFSRDQAPWMRESAKPVCCADARRRSAARMRDARTRAGVRRSLRGGPGQRMSLWVHGLAG